MDAFDKTSFDALLEALPDFQNMDSGDIMDSFLLDGTDHEHTNSFPGFSPEEQKQIVETFHAYHAQQHQSQAGPTEAPSNLFTMMANPASAYSATQFSVPPMASQPQHPAPHPSPPSPASPTIHLHLEQGGASSRQPIGHQALPIRALHNNNLPDRPSPESSPSSFLHESRPLNAPASPGIKRRQPSDDGGISSGRFSPSFVSPTGSSKRSANKIGSSPPSTTNAAFALPQAPESPAYPRSSLADLGAFNSEGDDGDDESGKRRAKNRLAQRKFREKQRSQVAQMQAQLDAKDAQLTAKDAQLQTAVSLIRDLTNQLALYRATFGPLPPLPGSRGGGVGGPSAPQGSQPQPDVAQP